MACRWFRGLPSSSRVATARAVNTWGTSLRVPAEASSRTPVLPAAPMTFPEIDFEVVANAVALLRRDEAVRPRTRR